MINVNMTDKAGVTLATAGKYCADNVKVTPSAEILRKDEQAKTATPTTSAQDITPDAGKALSKVTVNPITAAIVGNLDASSFAASIVAAVEGKGVTVPSGTLLDGMASLIESIEAGGIDLGQYFTDIAVASITPAEDCNLLDGTMAGFGINSFAELKFCLVVANNTYRKSIDGNYVRLAIKPYFTYAHSWRILYGTGTTSKDEKWIYSNSPDGGSTYKLKAGIPYEMIKIVAPN